MLRPGLLPGHFAVPQKFQSRHIDASLAVKFHAGGGAVERGFRRVAAGQRWIPEPLPAAAAAGGCGGSPGVAIPPPAPLYGSSALPK